MVDGHVEALRSSVARLRELVSAMSGRDLTHVLGELRLDAFQEPCPSDILANWSELPSVASTCSTASRVSSSLSGQRCP